MLKFPASLRVIGHSFVDWWDGWLELMPVTVLWFIAQLTIILGPPATFGYYYVARNLLNGQSLGVRGFFEGARKYFKQALLWGLVNILAIFVIFFAAWFYIRIDTAWGIYAEVLVLLVGYLWVCTQFYGLAYFIDLDNKNLYTALKNGLLTTLAAPFFTPILLVVALLVLLISVLFLLPLFLSLPVLVPILSFHGIDDRLVVFGLRKREMTPREIEMEQASRIVLPEFARDKGKNASISGGDPAANDQVADGEGQVKHKE